jgi:hypothetical protein
MRISKSAAIAAALFFFVACGGYVGCDHSNASGPLRIELNQAGERPAVDVAGLSRDQAAALARLGSRDAWAEVFRVAVAPDQPPMLGEYTLAGDRARFTPMFPLDPGRQYHVSFTPVGAAPLTATVGMPATHTTPTTVVAQVFPSGDVIPENQLRLYIHFSAPMGMKGGLDYVHLVDDQGKEVTDPFLPLDAEFWNDDRTRYTVFFDPGRQKRGIPVVEEMGRSLTEGKTYLLVVDKEWRDGNGLPLKETYKRSFKVGPPDERPLDHTVWQIQAPAAGTRTPLLVAFPEALDHGLLLRAVGVQGPDGGAIGGDITVGQGETAWSFTPRELWQAGTHNIVAFGMLEDLAGNRIGRAFEVDQFDQSDKSAEPEKTLIPVYVK